MQWDREQVVQKLRDRMSNSFSEHAAIVDAILAGDSDLVESLLRGHVVIQGQRFTDLIANLRQMKHSGGTPEGHRV